MSNKINTARKGVTKALKKHAEIVATQPVSLKKSQRAAAAVQAACVAYANAVYNKTGLDSPFAETPVIGLEPSTIASLEAERDALSTKPVAQVTVAAPTTTTPDEHVA